MGMAGLAIVLPQSIWALMVFKFELLIQAAPALILGVRSSSLSSKAILGGLIIGCVTAIVMKLSPIGQIVYGLHAGLWGLVANLLGISDRDSALARQRVSKS